MIETGDRVCRIVIAKPPEPVGAFAGCQLPAGFDLFFAAQAAALHDQIETVFCGAQHVPGAILFLVADPGRKRSVHPAAGCQGG